MRNPVPVDAIPDIGVNQQIVFTEWMGRSPQDVQDQITYPLTVALLGVPGVKTIRSFSMFGFSSIYVIFREDVDFYWSRSRLLEKLNSLSPGMLPPGTQPTLGPDATALGQVFWYTLEGRDSLLPEVEGVVGKLGRAESPLDPAPISMIETVINYKPEYMVGTDGTRLRFKFNPDKMDYFRDEDGSIVFAPDGMPYLVKGKFLLDEKGNLVPDDDGKPFRLWRPPVTPGKSDFLPEVIS